MRGIDTRQEIDPSLLLRDTRTMGQRMADFFSDATNVAVIILSGAGIVFVYPALVDFVLILGLWIFLYFVTRKQKLPFRLPKSAKTKDFNDIKSGSTQPNIARGITYFGNDKKSKEELWFTNDDMRTHVLIFGSTGAGKTETLVSLAFNALVQGSGFIYVDGKGDNSLYAKVFSMVRSMGREDDLLLVNFMTGARDIIGPQEKRLSNTLNPFCQGSSSMLTQLVVSLMSSNNQSGGDGDMWKGRAISFVEALMRILVYMRDQGAILLDANVIRNYFDLLRLETIVIDKIFPRDDQDSVDISGLPKVVTDPIRNYLFNLPGYNKEKKHKQVSQVFEQHGYITMQLGRTFSSLADTYGHIIRTNLAEVDFKDVVLNRRILVVLLPALEKSPDELSNLGKIIVSSLKAMMAAGLGEEVEGDYRDVILRKPTNAPTPYMCILDEYGYYAVQGFAVVPAQARSLGFSAIFAGQDLPAFQKASKEEAASIGANTNIKICMKLEDPSETWDFFTKTAGEAYVTKVDSFQTKEGSITNNYVDTRSSSFEKRARVDLLDLKEQTEGEAHIFFKSKIVRARMFYANPKPVKILKVNQFLKVEPPPDDFINNLNKKFFEFEKLVNSDDLKISHAESSEELVEFLNQFQKTTAKKPLERAIAVLLSIFKASEPEALEEIAQEIRVGELNIFSALIQPEYSLPILAVDQEAFRAPLVDINNLRNDLVTIEKLMGSKDKFAAMSAHELIRDIQYATSYPPEPIMNIDVEQVNDELALLIDRIRYQRDNNEAKDE